jgi:hypothetical protein
MRKAQKREAEKLVGLLVQAHEEIKKNIEHNKIHTALELLMQCQNGAVELGNYIEKLEGKDCATIHILESYCELVYEIHGEVSSSKHVNENRIIKNLTKYITKIENSIKNDIPLKREIVFLPYKASMWDSLESIYLAAKEDENCTAYVIPIPYYDRNPDGSMGNLHYEGDMYPADIPITKYDTYDFGVRRPDMIFIHNPYDDWNLVTSIHPFFYSDKMKKCTDCLVYVPYFATSGGQAEGQKLCPAYLNADYIVIQSEKYRQYYDASIPDEKFLAFGSPKFDSVIKKCQNPPEMPPEWKGKKVYFYNTSLGGMLSDTECFLKKMEYVFDTFKEHPEVCLIWRPHPLLESTFDSMRPQFKERYEALRQQFIDENIGIYDTTPSIEDTIAISDVYVGDSGTSVTSLFGVAGKPIFILDNHINTKPAEDDWRGEVLNFVFSSDGDNRWIITKGNKLWHSENDDYHYKYYCDLSKYSGGNYYNQAKQIGDKIYIMPNSAQDILVVEENNIRKIELKREISCPGAFTWALYTEKYAFLIPCNYPYLVRFDFETENVTYVRNISKFIVGMLDGQMVLGGAWIVGNNLYIGSPIDSNMLVVDIDTLEITKTKIPSSDDRTEVIGTYWIVPEGENLWLLPIKGNIIRLWNPKTNELKTYENPIKEFYTNNNLYQYGNVVVGKEKVLISPTCGNMYLTLDIKSGNIEQWNPPSCISQNMYGKNGYYYTKIMGGFMYYWPDKKGNYLIESAYDRKLFSLDIESDKANEIDISFKIDELVQQEAGFDVTSEWLMYSCSENAFNSLDDLISGNITGKPHSKDKQIESYSEINAAPNGDCGKRVYEYLSGLLQ